MRHLLFVCSQNRLRSPTAEAVFASYDGIEAVSAGTNADAATTVTGDLIEWADIIFVMESTHRNKLNKKFRPLLKTKRIVVLGIPDDFEYMEPTLVSLLKDRVTRHVVLPDRSGDGPDQPPAPTET